jgi:uncharacterized membrane protein YbaN (DUF454 family)
MRVARALYVALGVACVGIGAIGLVVPGLPTTVFLLIALWCFTKASPRLEAWLRQHSRLGPFIANWERDRSVPRGAKVLAGVTMLASVVVAGWLFNVQPLPLTVMAVSLMGVFAYIATRPEPSRAPLSSSPSTIDPPLK